MSDPVSTKYKVPDNLRPLLEAFARETLITQPPANPHVDVIGEEKLYNQFRTSLQQRITTRNSISEPIKYPTDTQKGSAHLPPLYLQSQRQETDSQRQMQPSKPGPGSSSNSRPTSPEALAATKIQAAYRGHFVRNHPEKFGIDSVDFTRRHSNDHVFDTKKDLKRHSVGGYSLETTKNSPDDRAATKIQAEIRGFLARKHVEVMKQKNNDAAVKIQSHIRGYLTRKNLNKDPRITPRSGQSDEMVH